MQVTNSTGQVLLSETIFPQLVNIFVVMLRDRGNQFTMKALELLILMQMTGQRTSLRDLLVSLSWWVGEVAWERINFFWNKEYHQSLSLPLNPSIFSPLIGFRLYTKGDWFRVGLHTSLKPCSPIQLKFLETTDNLQFWVHPLNRFFSILAVNDLQTMKTNNKKRAGVIWIKIYNCLPRFSFQQYPLHKNKDLITLG